MHDILKEIQITDIGGFEIGSAENTEADVYKRQG